MEHEVKTEEPEAPMAAEDDDEDLFNADDDDGDDEAEVEVEEEKEQPPTILNEEAHPPTPVAIAKEPEPEIKSGPAPAVAAAAAAVEAPSESPKDSSSTTEEKPASTKIPSADAPIPRISTVAASPAPAPASLSSSNKGNGQAAKYGLPEDINIPATVTPSLLQGRLLETLRGLPKQLITDALVEYDDAVQIKGQSIRNHGAYLFGVVKRYVSVQERAQSGEGEGILPMGLELTPAVNARLQKLVDTKFCTVDEMNEKVKSKIRMLSEIDALFAIEELSSVDRSQIRNFGSYFMGILNRYMRGERKDVTSGKKTLAQVRQAMQLQQSPQQHHPRFDDRRRDDRFQRGRDNEPQYRRGRDHTDDHRRERSRDRYGADMGGRRDSHDFQDPRNNPQRSPYAPMAGGPPPPPPRPSGMPNPYQQQQQQPGPYGQSSPHQPSPYGQPSSQYPPSMGGVPPPNPYGNPQRPPMMGGQQPPPQQYGQQPIVQQGQYGNMPQPGGVPGLPPGMQGNPSVNSYGGPPNQQQPPPYMGQQPPQQQQQQPHSSYSNPPYSAPPGAPNRYSQPPQGGGPNRWGNMQQQQQPPPSQVPAMDIMALADKASFALQAVQGGQHNYQISPPAGALPPMMQQQQQQPPNPYGAPASPYGQTSMSAPPGYPPSMNQPYQQQQQQEHRQQPNQQDYGDNKQRRRTTANIAELPAVVQYAVQNLQATGQISGPLDDGMLGMVKDLPEDLALQALQKFSSIDKNTMRNKTAYLAGVLRRELEKINRR